MGCVIDANIVKGVFQEDIAGSHALTASPKEMLNVIVTAGTKICLDDSGFLEHEWDAVVDSDWFAGWFVTLAAQANLGYLHPADCRKTIRHLQTSCGFPLSRDRVLVSLSVASAEEDGESDLITEDLDFFEPAAKAQTGARGKLLTGQRTGSVQKYLRKTHRVYVRSVILFSNSAVA